MSHQVDIVDIVDVFYSARATLLEIMPSIKGYIGRVENIHYIPYIHLKQPAQRNARALL